MTDNRTTELLPCPLCGDKVTEPLPKRWTNCLGDESWSASVACPACNLRIETRTVSYETERDAIEAVMAKWNTRTPEQAIAATLGSERNTSLDNVDAGRDAQFAEAMRRIVEKNTEFGVTDIEESHIKADELMCDLLLSHGYVETVDAFKNMRKWYG